MLSAAVTTVTEEAPVLWYANRGSGFVLLLLLTITTVAGVLAGAVPGSRDWPRAATQAMHRNVGLLSAAFLAVHAATTVVDEFVDVRWWQALVPFTSRTSATGSVSA
jgi:methionine sulfoxide reductase heme-binding subunit